MEQHKVVLASSVIIIILVSTTTALFLLGINEDDSPLNFYVFGDSQGYQGGVEQIVTIANSLRPDFLFHCGDLTPFGGDTQYQAIMSEFNQCSAPVYTTIGNHDIKNNGGVLYEQYFGSSTYSFNLGTAHFAVFNTSSGDVSEPEFTWLEEDLAQSNSDYKFVFTHIPPFDPRPEENHALINTTTGSRLMTLFEEQDVDVVFAGHIHFFNDSTINGVRYVVTGGAGASLYADEDTGGIYHFVNVTLNESGITIVPVLIDPPSIPRDTVVIRANGEDMTLSLEDLLQMIPISGFSSFQNQFENWRGQGIYEGILISDLLELIGSMAVNDTLLVKSFDGYTQEFCYSNVYPNETWAEIQGDMILAYKYNSTRILEWADGMRLVMIPPDGAYSNEDATLTSLTTIVSAGSRWVRFVAYLEVIST
ncbi:MAG: metallophosphoesterase [Candidatus Thorarchaeota archaeon]|nr:metallophosphoesterase [Candidatus Thorarchaeota archaeon]